MKIFALLFLASITTGSLASTLDPTCNAIAVDSEIYYS